MRLMVGLIVFCLAVPAIAQQGDEVTADPVKVAASPADGPVFPLGLLQLRYAEDHPRHPLLDPVMDAMVRLTPTDTGYIAERPDGPVEVFRLGSIGEKGTRSFHASAILMISRSIAQTLNDIGLVGVYVAPDPEQIDVFGEDLRLSGDDGLTMVVNTSVVSSTLTITTDDSGENRQEQLPRQDWIPERAPVRPWDGTGPRDDLLWLRQIEDYAFRLNRVPGRRIDVAVAAIEDEEGEPGVELEYLISESKPWRVYAQITNNGTPQTRDWRETFGYTNTQLTGRDDVLSLSYSTTAFDQSHTGSVMYEAPFERGGLWRYRLSATYSQYDASEVGVLASNFSGESVILAGEVSRQVYQDGDFFIDAFAGLSPQYLQTENVTGVSTLKGEEVFILPEIGVRAQRARQTESLFGQVSLLWNATTATTDNVSDLGRAGADAEFEILRWSGFFSFYLEPLFDRAAWEDPTTPETSTLAHEIALRFEGQHSFDKRLIPQQQMTLGGFYTVRGYPESAATGDTAIFGSAEYRLHVPRLLPVSAVPAQLPMIGQPFRVSAPQVYGYPDWDLVFKGFFDAGKAYNADRLGFENDELLIGTGVGVEISVKQTLQVRIDWGIGLKDLEGGGYTAGSNRFHIQAGLVY